MRRNTTRPPRPSRTSIPEADWTPNHVREGAAICYRLAERAQIDGDTVMATRLAVGAQGAAVSRATLEYHMIGAGVGNVAAVLRRVDQLATGKLVRDTTTRDVTSFNDPVNGAKRQFRVSVRAIKRAA